MRSWAIKKDMARPLGSPLYRENNDKGGNVVAKKGSGPESQSVVLPSCTNIMQTGLTRGGGEGAETMSGLRDGQWHHGLRMEKNRKTMGSFDPVSF